MKPWVIVVIGAAITFGLPAVVGIVVGHFFGWAYGLGVAGCMCVAVLWIAHRRLMGMAQRDTPDDQGKSEGE